MRLVPAVLLFLIASLAVVRAPTHLLWMLAVGVTELGHVLALFCIAAAIPLWNASPRGRIAAALCIAAAAMAITPVLRARWMTRELSLFRGTAIPGIQGQTLIYKDAGLSLDFYSASSTTRAPLIVVIHGGSWNSGDNSDFVSSDRYLAGKGFAVADLNYRLAPQHPFPAASEDVHAALAFLRKRADVDPDRIVLLGRSAGGQIALHVAYTANDPGIRGVISFYAPTDLFWSWEHPGNPLVIDTRAVLTDYLGGSPNMYSAKYADASPIRLATAASPPTLLFHGGRDELVSPYHSAALSKRLTELGVYNVNVSLPWSTHGFDYFPDGPGGQISTHAIESFLKRVMQTQA